MVKAEGARQDPDAYTYGGEFILADWPEPHLLRLALNRPPLKSVSIPAL